MPTRVDPNWRAIKRNQTARAIGSIEFLHALDTECRERGGETGLFRRIAAAAGSADHALMVSGYEIQRLIHLARYQADYSCDEDMIYEFPLRAAEELIRRARRYQDDYETGDPALAGNRAASR